jgi:hypothetical protein
LENLDLTFDFDQETSDEDFIGITREVNIMGGPGSGSWYRWDKRTTTEEVKRIDIRHLKKHGLLSSGKRTLSWNCGGEPSGYIVYIMHPDCMILDFKFRRNGGEWELVNQTINFDETNCNYGNTRKWFLCPHCDKRVAVLYGADKLFLCRKCYNLPYASQSEGHMERMSRKARKIRHRLDIDNPIFNPDNLSDGIYFKPKNMHQKTFDRLRAVESQAQESMNNAFMARYGHWL